MNQEIFKKIEINDTLSLEFWNSEAQIKNYCEGILNHNNFTDKKYTVTIQFKDKDAFVTHNKNNNYLIVLPKTELINDEELKLKNIIARTVFLRHELAHILYTDENFDAVVKHRKTYNTFEDARIENLYSKKYKGTYRLFRALIKNIYNHSKNECFKTRINIDDFALYCRLMEKNLEVEIKDITLQTTYEGLYQKYRYIFHHDCVTLVKGVEQIIKEIDAIEQDYQQQQAELKKQQQEQEKQSGPELPEENSDDNDQDDSDDEDWDSDRAEDQEDGETQESEGQNGSMDSETFEESDDDSDDDDEDWGDEDEDFDDDEDGESGGDESDSDDDDWGDEDDDDFNSGEGPQDDEPELEEESDIDTDNIEGSDVGEDVDDLDDVEFENSDVYSDTDKQEKDSVEEAVDELFDEDNFVPEEKLKTDDLIDYSGLLKQVSKQENGVFDASSYQFDINDFKEAQVINFDKMAKYLKTLSSVENGRTRRGRKKYRTVLLDYIASDASVIYRTIVNKHKKTINETVNFMKLKLKIRDKDRNLSNQVDGKLDQKNLKDLFTNKNMPEVFYRTIKTIKVDSEFYMLIDFSSSMHEPQKRDAIVTAIVMAEVCKALNIKYQIDIYASSYGIDVAVADNSIAQTVKNILLETKISNIGIRDNVSKRGRVINSYVSAQVKNIILRLKNIKDKHTAHTENLLATVYKNSSILSGGTPEFESFISIIKSNMRSKNTKKFLFLINDGAFSPSLEIQELPHNKNITCDKQKVIYKIDKNYFESNSKEFINCLLISKLKESLINTMEMVRGEIPVGLQQQFNDYLNHDMFQNPNNYLHMVENAQFIKEEYSKYEYYAVNYKEFFNANFFTIKDPMKEATAIYQKAIEDAKKYNFTVYGFGIRSNYGKKYLGENFEVFEDSADIENNFALKVRQIF